MARADAAKLSDHRTAGEIKVAKGVEQLVTDKLVSIPEAASVQHAVAADHRDIVQRTAARKCGDMRVRHIAQETTARARAISFLKLSGSTLTSGSWRRISGLANRCRSSSRSRHRAAMPR